MGRVFEFIANTADGVVAVNCAQTIVLWNDAATRLLGHRPEEVLGQKCYATLRGRDAEGCAVCRRGCDVISAAERLKFSPRKEIAVRTKQGDEVWLDVSTILVPSRLRELSALIHLFSEVTQQHEQLRVVQDFADVLSRLSPGLRTDQARDLPSADTPVDLTRRERDVLTQLTQGASTELIADRLSISERTVRNHINSVLTKLGVHSRLEAVTYSIRNRLV